jgi:probable addiction module antidote protein
MPIETVPFDSAQHLKTEADIARYLEAVLEANDPALHRHALTQIARARAAIRCARKDRSG